MVLHGAWGAVKKDEKQRGGWRRAACSLPQGVVSVSESPVASFPNQSGSTVEGANDVIHSLLSPLTFTLNHSFAHSHSHPLLSHSLAVSLISSTSSTKPLTTHRSIAAGISPPHLFQPEQVMSAQRRLPCLHGLSLRKSHQATAESSKKGAANWCCYQRKSQTSLARPDRASS